MTLDQLKYFVAVADFQHAGKAAKAINISPSAISHAIRQLEENLGFALIEHSGKNIYTTELGNRFAVRARQLLDQANQLSNEFQHQPKVLDGIVRIGATHTLSNYLLAPFLGRVSKIHREVQFDISSLRSANVVTSTAAGEIDIGLCFSPQPNPRIKVEYQKKIPLNIAVRKNHPLLNLKSNINVHKELSLLPCASPKAFSGIEDCENHPALIALKIRSNVGCIFDSYDVAAEFLKSTNAWCLMPSLIIPKLGLTSLSIKQLTCEADISIISPKGRAISKILIQGIIIEIEKHI